MRYRLGEVKIKSAANAKSIKIEGIANSSGEADRHNDVIKSDQWLIKNYLSNPIILFNHDPYFPLGQSKSVEAGENVLHVSGEINSPSEDPETVRVKQCIASGIIKAMSVGILPGDNVLGDDGINYLKAVDLYEISIVAAGASQKALFNVIKTAKSNTEIVEMIKDTQKAIKGLNQSMNEIKKTLSNKLKDINFSSNQSQETDHDIAALGEISNIIKAIENIN